MVLKVGLSGVKTYQKLGKKLQAANTRLRNGLGTEQHEKILERLPLTLSDEVIIRISTEYGWNDSVCLDMFGRGTSYKRELLG